jgi:hypothetical protein
MAGLVDQERTGTDGNSTTSGKGKNNVTTIAKASSTRCRGDRLPLGANAL